MSMDTMAVIDYSTYIVTGFFLAATIFWSTVAIQSIYRAFRQAGGEFYGYEQ